MPSSLSGASSASGLSTWESDWKKGPVAMKSASSRPRTRPASSLTGRGWVLIKTPVIFETFRIGRHLAGHIEDMRLERGRQRRDQLRQPRDFANEYPPPVVHLRSR